MSSRRVRLLVLVIVVALLALAGSAGWPRRQAAGTAAGPHPQTAGSPRTRTTPQAAATTPVAAPESANSVTASLTRAPAGSSSAVTAPSAASHNHPHSTLPAAPAPATTTLTAAGSVTAIGDSVMLDAQPSLIATIPGIDVDAAVSRQVSAGIAEGAQLASSGRLGTTVVFALGTNGTFSAAAFAQLVTAGAGRTLIVLTSHCPHCSWTASNNAMVHAHCTTATHCTVADWDALADQNPGWFGTDGVHMAIGGVGARGYADLVAATL